MTQLERADAIRAKFKEMFPEIDRLSRELAEVLDDAQNDGPHDGTADGTVSVVQFKQLVEINKCAAKLVLALTFDTRVT